MKELIIFISVQIPIAIIYYTYAYIYYFIHKIINKSKLPLEIYITNERIRESYDFLEVPEEYRTYLGAGGEYEERKKVDL